MNIFKKILSFLFVVISFFVNNQLLIAKEIIETKPIRLVVTIKPLYNLVAAITKKTNSIDLSLLLRKNFSPHDYNLKLSDVRLLNNADFIILIGDQLEFFLKKILSQDQFANKFLKIEDLPSLSKLNIRNSNYLDEHLWLSNKNAKIIVAAIEKKLISLDPANAKQYSQNKKEFLIKLDSTHDKIKAKLNKISFKKYLVFHDAYQYFEKDYRLQQPIIIHDNPSDSLSIKKMLIIRDVILQQNVKCLFQEPQFSSKTLQSLLKSKDLNDKLRIGILDPLGSDSDLGPDGYLILINNLADSFCSCFKD